MPKNGLKSVVVGVKRGLTFVKENRQFFQGFLTIISTQVRKLETELVDLNDKLKAEAPPAESGSKTVGETSKRILECQLKDYCKTK